jgi:hypothetical protein
MTCRNGHGDLEEDYGLVQFDSTSHALKLERALKAAGVTVAVIPTPVEFESGCGISLLVVEGEMEKARDVLEGYEGYRLLYPYARRHQR